MMNNEELKDIAKTAMKDPVPAGMFMLGLLEDSIQQVTKCGVSLQTDQELRSLLCEHEEKHYILFMVDADDGTRYWAVWELVPSGQYYRGVDILKGKWCGYIPTVSIKEVKFH